MLASSSSLEDLELPDVKVDLFERCLHKVLSHEESGWPEVKLSCTVDSEEERSERNPLFFTRFLFTLRWF